MTRNKVLLLASAAAASLLVPVLIGVLSAGPAAAQVQAPIQAPGAQPQTPAAEGARLKADPAPMPLVRVPPEYPPRALTRGIEGWVELEYTITTIGTVKDAVVVADSPSGLFAEAGLKAIARWRYNPHVENGVAVERRVSTRLVFELEPNPMRDSRANESRL